MVANKEKKRKKREKKRVQSINQNTERRHFGGLDAFCEQRSEMHVFLCACVYNTHHNTVTDHLEYGSQNIFDMFRDS